MTFTELEIFTFKKRLNLKELAEFLADYWQISVKSLTGKTRIQEVVDNKSILYQISYLNGYTQQEIANVFKINRSNIAHHLKKFSNIYERELILKYKKSIIHLRNSDFWKKQIKNGLR